MHYALIGNSSLSYEIAKRIRVADEAAQITLFCPEQIVPYYRHALPSLILNQTVDQVLCAGEEFYAQQRIRLVCDKQVVRVQPKRKRILTHDKEPWPFDLLVAEDLGPCVLPDFKGVNKKGVFHAKTFSDVKAMTEYASLTDIALVEVNSFSALQMACHLRKIEQEVLAVVPGSYLLSDILDKDVADFIVERCQAKGMRFIFNNAVTELLGDAEVKAIRLKTGKVLESELVVLAQADRPNQLFSTEELFHQEHDYIVQFEDVLCLKDLYRSLDRLSWEESLVSQYALPEQAANVVAGIFKQPQSLISLPLTRCTQAEDISISLLGDCKRRDQRTAYVKIDYSAPTLKKVFIEGSRICGAVCLNDSGSVSKLEKLIHDAVDVQTIQGSVLDYGE